MKNERSKPARAKPSHKRTNAELDKMSSEFDGEFVADTFGPPTPEAKKRLLRAKRKPGRPRVGAGSKQISVTVEKTLLSRIDRLAKRSKTPRSELIARGIRAVLREEAAAR